jgi:molybdate transport system ATP-binding protein
MGGQILIDIHKRFPRGPAVAASFSLGDVPITVLFGPSGCGKTTILRCIAGIETPGAGAIRAGRDTWFDSAAGVNLPPQRRRIGYVFQEQALFPHLTVRANIAYGLPRHPSPVARVDEMIQLLDLHDLQHRRPAHLSGGQRQRVALARALAPRPQLLLLDEPFASLDAPVREHLRMQLRRLILHAGTPALIVTHDRAEALALGDHIAVMTDGRVRQCGPVQEVFNRPADATIAQAVGMETVADGAILDTRDSLAQVAVGEATLTALNPHHHAGRVLVCIRGEDVTLRRGQPDGESARNRLSGIILTIEPQGPLVRIALDCGFPLTALITRNAREELGLVPGQIVTALIKAPAIHLIPREPLEHSRISDPQHAAAC